MFKKMKFVIVAIVTLIILNCTDENNPVEPEKKYQPFSDQKCGDWGKIEFEEYIIENNVWGKNNITNYSQCIGIDVSETDHKINWHWNWPSSSEGNVKAYPEIIYGWKPWGSESTTPKLPSRLSDGKSMKVKWDSLSTQYSGVGNTAFDIWLTSEINPSPNNITREIMIWLDHKEMLGGGSVIKTMIIDGESYDLYKADWNWTYLAFIKKSTGKVSELNLNSFFQYLINENLITNNEVVSAIEFGSEIIQGRGSFSVKDYSIIIE